MSKNKKIYIYIVIKKLLINIHYLLFIIKYLFIIYYYSYMYLKLKLLNNLVIHKEKETLTFITKK